MSKNWEKSRNLVSVYHYLGRKKSRTITEMGKDDPFRRSSARASKLNVVYALQ